MALPKLLLIYRSLKPSTRKEFGAFIRSPFANRREKLIRLVNAMEKIGADEDVFTWPKQKVFEMVFGREEFNDLRLNNLMSDLYRLLEKFLAWKQFEKNHEQKQLLVIENLLEKDIIGNAGRLIRKNTEKAQSKNVELQYKFNQLADQFHFQQSRKNDNKFLTASQENLHLYYLSAQLKIWCELLNRSNILSLHYDENKFQKFLNFLEQNLADYSGYYTMRIYYPILNWLRNPEDDTWFDGYRDKLFLHISEFPEQEAKEIIAYIQNYCVKRINQGRDEFLREWFEIIKFMLPLNLLNEGGHLSQWTYKNIVTTAVRLHEFEWTENFIHTWFEMLPVADRDNAYQYNLAVFYYESGDWKHAMQLLNKVNFSDPNYYLDAKSILAKIYFEQNEYEAIVSLRDAVKIYLLRERQLSREHHLQYKNLFAFTLKLYKLRLNKGIIEDEKYKALRKEINHAITHHSAIANKQWLLSKLEMI